MNFEDCDYSLSSSSSTASTDTRNDSSSETYQSSSAVNSISQLLSHKKRSGRKKFKETRHPTYRGVRQRSTGKWVCEVREPNKKSRIWLGTHSTPEMAARAHDVAVIALRGKSAPLNFPNSLWTLPRAKSSSAKDIQVAALEATQACRTTNASSPSSSSTRMSPRGGNAKVQEIATPFWDDEALFNMPALLASMAEGMLISPPDMQQDFYNWDDDMVHESNNDFSLWD